MFSLIEFIPLQWRESHHKAGNSGVYPHNGAKRVWVQGDCTDVDHLDTEWASVVRVAARLPEGETALDEIPGEALGGTES